jgi:hypothetical protein
MFGLMDEYHLILLPSNDVQLLIFFFAIEFFLTITHGPIPIWVYVIPIPRYQIFGFIRYISSINLIISHKSIYNRH